MKAFLHEMDEAAFGVGECVLILCVHVVAQFCTVITDGDDVEIETFVAEHFARDDFGRQSSVLAAGNKFLKPHDAAGKCYIFWLYVSFFENVSENGFLPILLGNEHQWKLCNFLERNGLLLVKSRAVFDQQDNLIFQKRQDVVWQ